MITHLFVIDKFIGPYIEFLEEFQWKQDHRYLYIGIADQRLSLPDSKNGLNLMSSEYGSLRKLFTLLSYCYRSDKLIIHGLYDPFIIKFLALQPWLLKKCFWVIWGGDLYSDLFGSLSLKDKFNRFCYQTVVGNVGHHVTHIPGDHELAKKRFNSHSKYHECFAYPSNLFNAILDKCAMHDKPNILIGNSGDPSNNHTDLFEIIKPFRSSIGKVYVPLSYGGDIDYVDRIAEQARRFFGDQSVPITELLPLQKYNNLIAQVDIAVFGHKRQQAMGNTTTLLGYGKKVFMRSDVTQWKFFKDLGIKVFDIDDFTIDNWAPNQQNIEIIRAYFSRDHLISQWKSIFDFQ